MKNLRITLGVAALAIGSFAAFSFAPASSNAILTENFVNPDGSPGAVVPAGENPCDGSTKDLCSQEYNGTQPTGNTSKMHYGERP